jgi:translation initiation factor IF-2
MTDERKPSLSDRPPLGPRGPDGPRGRPPLRPQRTKPVVVEVKRRRLRKEGEVPPPRPVVEENISLKPKRPAEFTPPGEEPKLTNRERDARVEALKDAIRLAEEDRMRAAEEKRARESEPSAGGALDADEEARRLAELDAKKKAAEESKKRADAEVALTRAAEKTPEKKSPAVKAKKGRFDDEEAGVGKRREADKKKHVKLARPDADRRRSGKLTVTMALEGGEEFRPRSIAALKRAQAKQKRALEEAGPQAKQSREVVVPEAITVQELANRMAEKAAAVIKTLMNMGVMATINDTLDQDTAELVVGEFGHIIKRVSEADVEIGLEGEADDLATLKPRPPVVTVMGHVDHGKTSLLDALRSTGVAAGEAGGITQHIGAYQVRLKNGSKITFLDTPGHEAFTEMRARGAQVTDIVVLVVAADDGVMPQTIEAINHAKAAKVPLIVAINKIDKPGASPDKVRQALLQHEIVVEKMSGEVLDVEVSALKKTGLDKLEEAILLQAEVLDLKANPERAAEGVVIEAKLDKGRGAVATMLVQRGTLKVGDILVAGAEWGRVRALIDDKGAKLKKAGPSTPVEVLGLSSAPLAGNPFTVVEDENRAREVSRYRQQQDKDQRVARATVSLESMFSAMKEKKAEIFPIILKADVQGSVEAISAALGKIGNESMKAEVIHGAVGAITETDIALAKASGAFVIGFNVRANSQAREAAERDHIPIQYFAIIYELSDAVKTAMEGKMKPLIEETVIARAEVKDVFQAGKKGRAAGSIILEGAAKAGAKIRLLRDNVVVYTGRIESLRRFKDDVKEVKAGVECGILLENFSDVKKGDALEVFETTERQQTL